MAVSYDATLKTARMSLVRDALNGGTIELATKDGAVLVIIPLANPSGRISGDTFTFDFSAAESTAAIAEGVAAVARARGSDGAVKIKNLTVGVKGSGTNVQLATTTIAKGQPVRLTSGEIQHAA
jgi:antitoxin (DNA-binding transcriptional repressor) of toxin-antitoxin stability system